MRKILKNTFLLVTLFVFIAGGFLGMSHFGMNMSGDGVTASHCLIPMVGEDCQMSLSEHIAEWQNMFAAIHVSIISIATILVSLAIFLVSYFLYKFVPKTFPRQSSFFILFKPYFRRPVPIFDQLQEAYSNGILNPKLH